VPSTTTTTSSTATTTSTGGTPTTSTTTTTLCAVLLKWGTFGTEPGEFWNPSGVAVTADGQRVFTVDLGNNRVQEFDGDGGFVRLWGGPGTADGQFDGPADIGVGPGGGVYVVDQRNQRVQMFDAAGAFVTTWGSAGSAAGAFLNPRGIGIDAAGNVYIADPGNHRVQKFDAAGAFLTAWGTLGGFQNMGQFMAPRDVAADGTRWIYVTDLGTPWLQRFLTDGTPVDTPVTSVPFDSPVAVDAAGRVYYGNPTLYRSDLVTPGPGIAAWVGGSITGIAPAPGNVVYVSDYGTNKITKLFCP
jgi:DNA-binding beta-propeller fold protein YncE